LSGQFRDGDLREPFGGVASLALDVFAALDDPAQLFLGFAVP